MTFATLSKLKRNIVDDITIALSNKIFVFSGKLLLSVFQTFAINNYAEILHTI